MDCIFCKIIAGDIPCAKVYEDDDVLCFRDLHPVAPSHVLIVPRAHYADLRELARDGACPTVMAAVARAAERVAALEGLDGGFRLINNCGPDGGQTVMHLHFHLIGGRSLGASLL